MYKCMRETPLIPREHVGPTGRPIETDLWLVQGDLAHKSGLSLIRRG